MGHSVSKFRSLPLTSYAANPLAIVDPAYCQCDASSTSTSAATAPATAIAKLHVRQSGAVALAPSHCTESTLTVTDDRGAVIFHLDGPPHLLLPQLHLHHHGHHHDQNQNQNQNQSLPPGQGPLGRPPELHMTNVYGEEILHIHAEPAAGSGPPSPSTESLPQPHHGHPPNGNGNGNGDVSPPLVDDAHSLAASGRSSSHASISSISHHAPGHKLDALTTFPIFSIHRPASAVIPPSPMWDRTSMNSFDAVLLSCGDSPSNAAGTPSPFLTLPPSTLPVPPLPSRSSASMTTSASNSTAQTHRLAALWTHDPTLCMHVEATKLNLHSHSVTLAVSCPRNGTLFVKAATDAPVTFIFSGHPSHGGLLVARAYRMPPTAADLARSSSFTGGGGSSASTTAASLHRHATPSPTRSASLSRTHSPAPGATSSPPTTSKQVKPPPTLSRSADLFSVDIAPGVDQAGIVALCVIAEALRAHLVATHLAHHPRHRDGFLTHASMKRKPSGASDTSRRSSLRGGGGMEGPQRHAHAHASPMMPASPRFAGSLLRPTALTRSNSVPFDSLAGVLGEPPALSTSAPPPMMDAGAGGYVSPLVARLKAEELGTSSRQSSDQGPEIPVDARPGVGARRNSNPGPIRWAADMFRHRDKKKKGKDKDKDKNAHEGGSNGSLDSSQKVGKSHGSLVSAGS